MNKLFPLKNEAVVFSLLIRGCNILLGIAIVPVLIASVGLEGYGWWVSIYAVVSWNGLFDLGLNNGFRIKGAEQVFQSHSHGWRRIASTTLVLMGGMALVVVSCNIVYFLIKAIVGMESPLDLSYFMMILLVGLNQFLRFGTSAASIFGKPYFDSLFATLSLLMVCLVSWLDIFQNIDQVVLVYVIVNLGLYLGFNILVILKHRSLWPKKTYIDKEIFRDLLSTSSKFLIIQILGVIIYSSLPIIATTLFDAKVAAKVSIPLKVYGLPFALFSLYVSSQWPEIVKMLAKSDLDAGKDKVREFKYAFVVFICLMTFLFYNYYSITNIWLGNEIGRTSYKMNLATALYYILMSYNTIYVYFVNSVEKFRSQIVIYLAILISWILLIFLDYFQFIVLSFDWLLFVACGWFIVLGLLLTKETNSLFKESIPLKDREF